MTYYFELPGDDTMRYVWCRGYGLGYDVQKGLTYRAHRIWQEDEQGQVTYVKHRTHHPEMNQVDMKEFVWVKLSAVAFKP